SSCRRHGYSRDEMLTKTIFDLDPTTTPETWPKVFGALKGRGSMTFESLHRTRDGELFPVEVSANFVESSGEELVFGFARDITDRKRAEEALKESEQQLRQAQKMEAVGQLAGGIAHDFNNLLTAIIGNSSLALGAMAAEDPNRELIADIKETGERAAGLTRQILAFSRRQILKPQILQLNDIFLGMEPLLRRTLGEDIDLRFFLASDLRETEVDPHQMEQVLMNLVLNARDAMPEGGHLTVETANVTLDRKYARIHPEVEPGRYVTLSVTDTGCGMCEETRSRIFEPFFTTKEVGKGTGLGLSTVFGIVKQSGGSISVYSEPGTGSTFKAYLPVSVTVAAPEADSPLEGAMVRGSETILVVEDEASVRQLVVRILSRSGFAVLEAASAHELDAVLKGDGPVPDLLLTDVVLPGGTSGREVAEVLLARYPDLSVIFMSGYTRDSVVHNGRLDEGIEFLGKPFTPEMLSHKVRLVLDRRAAAGKKQSS
ncbi:MAG TPA: ATP-binding protein, partial [Thermoleophilia bacterium]